MFRIRPTRKKTPWGTLYLKCCKICREVGYFQRGIEICQDCSTEGMREREERVMRSATARIKRDREIFGSHVVQ